MLRKYGHLTPRYLIDRMNFALYQRRHPEKPWLTPLANRLLEMLLRPEDVGIEWGSGRSTIWLARRMRSLTSIEADPAWYQRIKTRLAEERIDNVDYRHHPVEDEEERESDYTRAADGFAEASITFALIDGAARGTCANAVVPKLAVGAMLVIDNINWYLDFNSRAPGSRNGMGPRDEQWRRFQQQVAHWRMIRTTSGVSDTAIWIKTPARENTDRS